MSSRSGSSSIKESSEKHSSRCSSSRSNSPTFNSSSSSQEKISPIKAPVGLAPPPEIINAKSKVGSLDNIDHKPKGGDKKIFNEKLSFENIQSKVGSKDYINHEPGGGTSIIFTENQMSSRSSSEEERIDDIDSHTYACNRSRIKSDKRVPPIKGPAGIASPADIENAESKVGSLDNINHKPKGGDKKIETYQLDWKASSKVGSLDNVKHKPGGGDKLVFDEKRNFKGSRSRSISSSDSFETKSLSLESSHWERCNSSSSSLSPQQSLSEGKKIPPIKAPVRKAPPANIEGSKSKIGSLDNISHVPRGGSKKILTQKLNFKDRAKSKVGSLDNIDHKPGGGKVEIIDEKFYYNKKGHSK